MKICLTCSEPFQPRRAWQAYCSAHCQTNRPSKAAETRDFQQARRDRINRIKLTAGCSRCGFNDHPAALDFHHTRGEKSFNVSGDPKRAWASIEAEIEKCDILCANCHRIETAKENHGRTKRTGA